MGLLCQLESHIPVSLIKFILNSVKKILTQKLCKFYFESFPQLLSICYMHRFDILVNGGGSVTLEFTRQPFQSHTISVSVPWNQIITIEPVIMDLHSIDFSEPDPSLCAVGHDHHTMKPIVLSTWQHTQLGACPEKSTLIPESQVCCTSGPQSMHSAL